MPGDSTTRPRTGFSVLVLSLQSARGAAQAIISFAIVTAILSGVMVKLGCCDRCAHARGSSARHWSAATANQALFPPPTHTLSRRRAPVTPRAVSCHVNGC